jgi:hypothetical protein
VVFLWLGADKDAFVSCGRAGPPCPLQDRNFGREGFVSVSKSAIELRKGYVHFGLPTLPPGTVVEEAYFEMYHPAQREDGQTDDIQIPVGRASGAWTALGLTLGNEPNRSLVGGETAIKLNSMNWSGTPNISHIVRDWYATPASNNGFYLYWSQETPGIDKGFYSNNDVRRRVDNLGLSPRLLVRVRLAAGRSASEIVLPPLLADNDLSFSGRSVLMGLVRAGSDWPAEWMVRKGL